MTKQVNTNASEKAQTRNESGVRSNHNFNGFKAQKDYKSTLKSVQAFYGCDDVRLEKDPEGAGEHHLVVTDGDINYHIGPYKAFCHDSEEVINTIIDESIPEKERVAYTADFAFSNMKDHLLVRGNAGGMPGSYIREIYSNKQSVFGFLVLANLLKKRMSVGAILAELSSNYSVNLRDIVELTVCDFSSIARVKKPNSHDIEEYTVDIISC